MSEDSQVVSVSCPYCGETVELVVQADLRGELVQDCEVCCNPWQVTIEGSGASPRIDVRRLDD